MKAEEAGAAGRPLNPYLVMGIAALLPGVGQLLNYQGRRALTFLFFLLIGGWISSHLSGTEQSFIARYAGGVFVYAVSVLDAYKWARVRWVLFHYRDRE